MSPPSDATARRLRGAFAVSFLAVTMAYAVRAQYYDILSGSSGQVGSWLVNYGGGFVRRGLFGQLFLSVAPHAPAAVWYLFAFQVACYLLVLTVFILYLHENEYRWSAIALACGPAALPFIAWDWQGGFRQELLVFVALSLLVLAQNRTPGRRLTAVLACTALAFFTLAVFSWEPSLLAAPAMIYLLLRVYPIRNRVWDSPGVPVVAVVAACGLVASVAARGDAGSIDGIYRALDAHGLFSPAFNTSAVESLAWSDATVRQTLRSMFPTALVYLPLTALALLPVLTNPWAARNWKWIAACAPCIVPLFFVAIDYGRFVHLLVMELSLCIVAEGRTLSGGLRWSAIPTVVYVTIWGVPYMDPLAGPYPFWFGLASTLTRIVTGQ